MSGRVRISAALMRRDTKEIKGRYKADTWEALTHGVDERRLDIDHARDVDKGAETEGQIRLEELVRQAAKEEVEARGGEQGALSGRRWRREAGFKCETREHGALNERNGLEA